MSSCNHEGDKTKKYTPILSAQSVVFVAASVRNFSPEKRFSFLAT